MFMQNIIHHPHWDEWVRMIRNGLQDHLQKYDMGQQEAWLRCFFLGEFCYYPKAPIVFIHALKNTHIMKKEEWLALAALG